MLPDMLIVLLILLLPRAMVLLCSRYKALDTVGAVFLCYFAGFLLSFAFADTSMAATVSEVCVPIAIPLILFGSNLASLKKLAKPAIVSFALMCVAVIAASTLGFLIFRGRVEDAAIVSGTLIGLYTGGTPNLMAIGMALGMPQARILLVNTADFIAGGLYFFLLISVMPRVVRRVLPKYLPYEKDHDEALTAHIEAEYAPAKMAFSVKGLLCRAPAVLLSLCCVGASLAASLLITGELTDIMVVMLGVTTFGIALSFVKRVRSIRNAYSSGQYFIYMFSVAMGLSFDLSAIGKNTLLLLVMLLFVQFGSLILHMILARIFKIDADTALVTSTAGIYGPAFIPSVTRALQNDEVLLAGLLCGILGYGVGNYLGIGVASLLMLL